MKLKTQSPHVRTVRDLLYLAVIGFVLWLAAIGWLPISSANAAPEVPRHGDPGNILARKQTPLNLTGDRVDRKRPILEGQTVKRRQLREQFRGQGRRAMRSEMLSMREETDRAMTAVLTAEQMVK